MAELNFGGVVETVVTSKEFSLEKALEVLKRLPSSAMVSKAPDRLATCVIMALMSL